MRACRSLAFRAVLWFALAVPAPAVVLVPEAPAWAQKKQSAESLIARGRVLFDDQQYEESIQTLSAALLRPDASKPERIETYRLLAYNYVVLGRKDEADAAVRGLYVLDPEFALPKNESPRFRTFFDEVRKKWEAEGRPGIKKEEKGEAAPPPVKLEHASPAEAERDKEVVLTGKIDDPESRVATVRVMYRSGAKGKFAEAAASLSGGQFRASIPPAAVQPPLVEYYIEALDKGKLPVVARGDALGPLRIAVAAPASGGMLSSPWFWTGAGAVVVGGIVAAVLLTKKGEAGGSTPSTARVTVLVGE